MGMMVSAGGDGSLGKEEMQQGFWGGAGFSGHAVCLG